MSPKSLFKLIRPLYYQIWPMLTSCLPGRLDRCIIFWQFLGSAAEWRTGTHRSVLRARCLFNLSCGLLARNPRQAAFEGARGTRESVSSWAALKPRTAPSRSQRRIVPPTAPQLNWRWNPKFMVLGGRKDFSTTAPKIRPEP